MLLKLLKYDLRSMWKQFRVIWPAALILGLLNRFVFSVPAGGSDMSLIVGSASYSAANEWLGIIALTAFVGVYFAMVVVTFVFVLTRFYRGLLGDEGYLMHTLPVQSWQLVLSKLVCSLVVTIANGVVGLLALILMMPVDWRDIFNSELWRVLIQAAFKHPDNIQYCVEFFLAMLTMFAAAFMSFYLAMAIGHLFSRRRVLMSVAAFFGLEFLGNTLTMALNRTNVFSTVNGHGEIWLFIGFCLIAAALMFLATSWILKHRLNLE